MERRFDLIVFDWDGTLMDSAAAIVDSIRLACRDLEVSPPSDAQARYVIGLGLGDAMRHAVPNLPESLYPKMVERYRYHYLSRDHDIRLFEGAYRVVEWLKQQGVLLAVATGKSRIGLDRALRVSGLESFFHATRTVDECFSKPHPQMLDELMNELGVVPQRTVMVGDTTHDLLMARQAGVSAVGLTYGAHSVELLQECGPLALADNMSELFAIVQGWVSSA